jgi:hypothetical protein
MVGCSACYIYSRVGQLSDEATIKPREKFKINLSSRLQMNN